MINGNKFRDMVISGANNIENQKESINKLNVFPVPDGDTGTNMSLTINAAARDIASEEGLTIGEIADKVAFALLRGARGNSGVILSLLFRGISKGLKDKVEADGADLAKAFGIGVESAYKAVMKPTEGTILTVAREASEKCAELAKENQDALTIMKTFLEEGEISLANTPNLLPALKQANVVDAGGKGLLTIFYGMLKALEEDVIIEKSDEAPQEYDMEVDFSQFDTGEITFTYCTEFIVVKENEGTECFELRNFLETIGDCVVAVDDDKIIKVHVHTNNPGLAIQKGLEFGYLINMKIDNMKYQHENKSKETKEEDVKPSKKYGFVSISAGEGLTNIFKDLGVDVVVEGGQTMNPSTDDILKAVKQTPAEIVFVLPNNKNIIMAAEQTKELISDKEVVVIPTKTVPQGISALLFFNPDLELSENITEMDTGVAGVKTAQITFAARDSVFDDKEIKEGQYLGLLETKVSFVEDDIEETMKKLVDTMMSDGGSIVTLYYGSDVSDEDAEKMAENVTSWVGTDAEVTLLPGNQPVYYYIISVE